MKKGYKGYSSYQYLERHEMHPNDTPYSLSAHGDPIIEEQLPAEIAVARTPGLRHSQE